MGHLMSTMRDIEAADQAVAQDPVVDTAMAQAVADVIEPARPEPVAEAGAPLPRVSTMLVFHPRPGEILRGRKEVAAMVVNRRVDQRLLDLIVFYDADDVRQIDRVPERTVEGERGWEMPQPGGIVPAEGLGPVLDTLAAMRQEVAGITGMVQGDFERPEVTVLEMINALNEQCDEIEKKLDAVLAWMPAAAAPAKAEPAKPRKARTVPAPRVEAAADETQVARSRGRFGGKR